MSASWKRLSSTPIVLGHRGARETCTENTLRAFQRALDEGAAGTELDVMLSGDGVPVVFHDFDLSRMTGGRDHRRVVELTARQLFDVPLLDQGRIPSLTEVVEWAVANDVVLNIELKSQRPLTDRVADAVADLLRQYPTASDFALISSFHPTLVRRFGLRQPDIETALLVDKGHACLMHRAWVNACRAAAVHPHAELLERRPELLERVEGLLVNSWTVNDGAQARRLRDLGVSGIITDRPAAILRALRER